MLDLAESLTRRSRQQMKAQDFSRERVAREQYSTGSGDPPKNVTILMIENPRRKYSDHPGIRTS